MSWVILIKNSLVVKLSIVCSLHLHTTTFTNNLKHIIMINNKYNIGEKVYVGIDDFGYTDDGVITKIIATDNGINYAIRLKDICGYDIDCKEVVYREEEITTSKAKLLDIVLNKKIKFFLMNECFGNTDEDKLVKDMSQCLKDCIEQWTVDIKK